MSSDNKMGRQIPFLCLLLPLITGYFIVKIVNFRTSFLTYYDSDLDEDVSKIIKRYVGVCEIHEVETEDGYTLKLFRIPRENPKGVILFQHPVFADARLWLSFDNDSIAYLFWRTGYDVWLGNSRGNVFGRRHRKFKLEDRAFWNFTFHEMGYYDNLAITGYIKEKMNSKIIYLGFSMGSSSGLVYASTRSKEAADSIKAMFVLAPPAYISKPTSLVSITFPLIFYLQKSFGIDIERPIIRMEVFHLRLYEYLNTILPCKKIIGYLNGLINGRNPDEDHPDFVDVSKWGLGSESSLKVIHHYFQIFSSTGDFQMYDHGAEQNLILYGNSKPPLYPLDNIKVPILVIYGEHDAFIVAEDSEKLYDMLPKNSTIGKMMVQGFKHLDFVRGSQRNEMVYDKILQVLETI